MGYSPWGCEEVDTTEQLTHTHTHTHTHDRSSQPGIEPTPSALEDEVLTTGLPGKSLDWLSYIRGRRDAGESEGLFKKRSSEDSRKEGSHLQVQEKIPTRNQACQHLDFGLPASGTEQKLIYTI